MAVKLENISAQSDDKLLEEKWKERVSEIDKTPNGNLFERLTLSEIEDRYPRQWVGLTDIERESDGVNIVSSVVGYVNMSKNDLTVLQVLGLCKAWYTSPNDLEVL